MILLPLLLLAADPPAAVPAPAATPAPGEKLICRRLDRTGSRLRSRPVCATAFEWKVLADRARRDLEGTTTKSQPEKLPTF